jgi:hypothetical protein
MITSPVGLLKSRKKFSVLSWQVSLMVSTDRGEGQSKAVETNAPPLPGPLLHWMEEREWSRVERVVLPGDSFELVVGEWREHGLSSSP